MWDNVLKNLPMHSVAWLLSPKFLPLQLAAYLLNPRVLPLWLATCLPSPIVVPLAEVGPSNHRCTAVPQFKQLEHGPGLKACRHWEWSQLPAMSRPEEFIGLRTWASVPWTHGTHIHWLCPFCSCCFYHWWGCQQWEPCSCHPIISLIARGKLMPGILLSLEMSHR